MDAIGYGTIQAAPFTLSATKTLTEVVFWDYEENPVLEGVPQPQPPGAFWTIYANASGTPGNVIASGFSDETALADGGMTAPWPWPIGEAFQVNFSVGSLTLSPGSYWLGITEPSNPQPNWDAEGEWIDTTTNGDGCCQSIDGANWTHRSLVVPTGGGNDLAFELLGSDALAPEPGSLPLALLGAALLFFHARSRMR